MPIQVHDTKNITPSFGFGHGLSYTTFLLRDINSDKKKYSVNDTIKVTCKLTNTGDIDGKEVVQVYIGKKNSKIKMPLTLRAKEGSML